MRMQHFIDLLLEVPEGVFHYDAASDMSGAAKAKIIKFVVDSKNFVRIKFYRSNESETYAEVCCALFSTPTPLTMPFYCSVRRRRSRTHFSPFPLCLRLDHRVI